MKTTLLALLALFSAQQAAASLPQLVPVVKIESEVITSTEETRYDLVLLDKSTDQEIDATVVCKKSAENKMIVNCDFRSGMIFGLYCLRERQSSEYQTYLVFPDNKCSEIMNGLLESSTTGHSLVIEKRSIIGIY